MKILIKSYMELNVGDDLYLHILFKRYTDVNFDVLVSNGKLVDTYNKAFSIYKNVNVKPKSTKLYSRIQYKLRPSYIDKIQFKTYDACVYIGGSLFIENTGDQRFDNLIKKEVSFFNRHKKPVFILSSNFGPYINPLYVAEKAQLFSECYDVCFRDQYSYNMFNGIKSVRYAPDAIFTIEPIKVSKESNSIGYSAIDLSNRAGLSDKRNEYINMLAKSVAHSISEGKNVYLFAFCKLEGDERAAKDILERLSEEEAKKIKIVSYDGDLEAFLKLYLSVEEAVCTRFHAMVLSFLSAQKFVPIIYSDKSLNVIKDLSLSENYIEIIKIDKDSSNLLNEAIKNVNVKEDFLSISNDAEKIFHKIDNFIKKSIDK